MEYGSTKLIPEQSFNKNQLATRWSRVTQVYSL